MRPSRLRVALRALASAGVMSLGVSAALLAQIRSGSGHPVAARLSKRGEVQLLDLKTGSAQRIYQSSAWVALKLSMAPTGRLLGLLEVAAGVVRGTGYATLPRATLVIIDTAGSVVRRIDADVANYTWCGPTCVAYISGPLQEFLETEAVPTGVGIADVVSGHIDRLLGPPWPSGFAYSRFDSSLYLAYANGLERRLEVRRYDLATGSLTPTSHKGIAFSDDGKFYLSYSYPSESEVPSPPRVYDALTDAEVVLSAPAQGVPIRWLPSGGSHLLIRKASTPPARAPAGPFQREPGRAVPSRTPAAPPDVDFVVYDVQSRLIVRSLRAQFPSWSAPSGVVPFESGGHADAIARP